MGWPHLLEQGGMCCLCQTLPILFTCSFPGPVARRSAQRAGDASLAEAHFSGGDHHLQTSTVACTVGVGGGSHAGRPLLEGAVRAETQKRLVPVPNTQPSAASPRVAVSGCSPARG